MNPSEKKTVAVFVLSMFGLLFLGGFIFGAAVVQRVSTPPVVPLAPISHSQTYAADAILEPRDSTFLALPLLRGTIVSYTAISWDYVELLIVDQNSLDVYIELGRHILGQYTIPFGGQWFLVIINPATFGAPIHISYSFTVTLPT